MSVTVKYARGQEWRGDLLRAADHLVEYGWIRGDYGIFQGEACAVGAVGAVKHKDANTYVHQNTTALDKLAAYLLDRGKLDKTLYDLSNGDGYQLVPSWNDAAGRTGREVISAMRWCARTWECPSSSSSKGQKEKPAKRSRKGKRKN